MSFSRWKEKKTKISESFQPRVTQCLRHVRRSNSKWHDNILSVFGEFVNWASYIFEKMSRSWASVQQLSWDKTKGTANSGFENFNWATHQPWIQLENNAGNVVRKYQEKATNKKLKMSVEFLENCQIWRIGEFRLRCCGRINLLNDFDKFYGIRLAAAIHFPHPWFGCMSWC